MILTEYKEGQEVWFSPDLMVILKGVVGSRYLAPHVPNYYFITVISPLNPAISKEYSAKSELLFESEEDCRHHYATWEERNGKWKKD